MNYELCDHSAVIATHIQNIVYGISLARIGIQFAVKHV